MTVKLRKPTLYETKQVVRKGTLLIALDTEFDLTADRVYVATKHQGEGTFHDCIFVMNDKGIEQDYSSEFFTLYEGERVVYGD